MPILVYNQWKYFYDKNAKRIINIGYPVSIMTSPASRTSLETILENFNIDYYTEHEEVGE